MQATSTVLQFWNIEEITLDWIKMSTILQVWLKMPLVIKMSTMLQVWVMEDITLDWIKMPWYNV